MATINSTEPVMIWGALGLVVGGILAWLVPDMPDPLVQNITSLIALAGPPLAGMLIARSKVTPTAKIDAVPMPPTDG